MLLGVNVMPTLQVALAATALVQVLEANVKSAAFTPVSVIALIFRLAFPLFVMVTTTGALVAPCVVLGNVIGLLGATATSGSIVIGTSVDITMVSDGAGLPQPNSIGAILGTAAANLVTVTERQPSSVDGKFVVTSTPPELEWPETKVVKDGLADFVVGLKEQPGGDIGVSFGFAASGGVCGPGPVMPNWAGVVPQPVSSVAAVSPANGSAQRMVAFSRQVAVSVHRWRVCGPPRVVIPGDWLHFIVDNLENHGRRGRLTCVRIEGYLDLTSVVRPMPKRRNGSRTRIFRNCGSSIYTQAHAHGRRFLIDAGYVDPGTSRMDVCIAGESG